jgi:hypothetical protein
VPGRVLPTNGDRWFLVQLYRLISVDFAGPYDHPTGDIGPLASGWRSQLLALALQKDAPLKRPVQRFGRDE